MKEPDKEHLQDIAKSIIFNFKKYYLNDRGLISRTFPPSSRTIFDNFDDLAPFFIYFGETDFLLDQVVRLKNFSYNEILAHENLIYSYRIDEFLGGIFCLWEKTKDSNTKILLNRIIEKTTNYFVKDNNIYGTYDIYRKKQSSHYYFWASGLLETFLEMSDYYPDLENKTIKIVDYWLKNKFFLKYHLFPFRYTDNRLLYFFNVLSARLGRYYGKESNHQPFQSKNLSYLRNKVRYVNFTYFTSGLFVQLMKSNTTVVFTLINLYNRLKDEKYKTSIINWINAVRNKLVSKEGNVYGIYLPTGKIEKSSLVNSFILIDVLMDTYFYVQEDHNYLELAKKIIDRKLASRWKNGLIPLDSETKKTHIDALVDFAISMRRYAELSGEEKYLYHSYEIMEKTLKLHYDEKGYYTHVDENGRPIKIKVNAIDPKYNGLLLKGIINMLTISDSIYTNPALLDLFKDR